MDRPTDHRTIDHRTVVMTEPTGAGDPPPTWEAPRQGHWRRDFRLGEWLADPVTPLFATWFLPEAEAGFDDAIFDYWGARMALPLHVIVNGWYYTNPGKMATPVRTTLRHPVRLFRWGFAFATIVSHPERGERAMAVPAAAHYESTLLPAYRSVVDAATGTVGEASPAELVTLVDQVTHAAGGLLLPLAEVLGFASKAELSLAAFHRKHLEGTGNGGHQPLLAGLGEARTPRNHAVTSIDWSQPTLGELDATPAPPSHSAHATLVATRREAETACRHALADEPDLLAAFERRLDLAQRYAVVREDMADELTIGWPVLRHALHRLGEHLVATDAVDDRDDVFFCEHDEVTAAATGGPTRNLRPAVATRREQWQHQRTLDAPLAIGKLTAPMRRAAELREQFRSNAITDDHLLVGVPGSPGRATGPARVVLGPDDFDRVEPGDVLVAPMTTPAWTPIFGLVAGIVTDTGSVIAHASMVAREYGIPAVVGTGSATRSLVDGTVITVDGDRGVVDLP